MPRKPEPSWELKKVIWDVAATVGTDNLQSILRQLDYELEKRRKEGEFFEDIPEERTIKRIIEKDINKLEPEVVVSKLESHIWHLRNDYEAIKQLAERISQTPQEVTYYERTSPPISIELRYYLKNQLLRHFDDLAITAEALAKNMGLMLEFIDFMKDTFQYTVTNLNKDGAMRGNIVDGAEIGIPLQDGRLDIMNGEYNIKQIDDILAQCLLEHFNHRFPKLAFYRHWRVVNFRNVKHEIAEQLRIMVLSKNFGVCPTCVVCKDLEI